MTAQEIRMMLIKTLNINPDKYINEIDDLINECKIDEEPKEKSKQTGNQIQIDTQKLVKLIQHFNSDMSTDDKDREKKYSRTVWFTYIDIAMEQYNLSFHFFESKSELKGLIRINDFNQMLFKNLRLKKDINYTHFLEHLKHEQLDQYISVQKLKDGLKEMIELRGVINGIKMKIKNNRYKEDFIFPAQQYQDYQFLTQDEFWELMKKIDNVLTEKQARGIQSKIAGKEITVKQVKQYFFNEDTEISDIPTKNAFHTVVEELQGLLLTKQLSFSAYFEQSVQTGKFSVQHFKQSLQDLRFPIEKFATQIKDVISYLTKDDNFTNFSDIYYNDLKELYQKHLNVQKEEYYQSMMTIPIKLRQEDNTTVVQVQDLIKQRMKDTNTKFYDLLYHHQIYRSGFIDPAQLRQTLVEKLGIPNNNSLELFISFNQRKSNHSKYINLQQLYDSFGDEEPQKLRQEQPQPTNVQAPGKGSQQQGAKQDNAQEKSKPKVAARQTLTLT